MKLATRNLIYASAIIISLSIAIKMYYEFAFRPKIDAYIEESIKESMEKDLKAFEKIILTVVKAAGGDGNVVRQALIAISKDKGIPISIKRSDFINRQFGTIPERSAANDIERLALKGGKAVFRKTRDSFEYIYPLKAGKICQTCHIDKSGKKVAIGYPLGLAIKTLPRSIVKDISAKTGSQTEKGRLARELSLVYYVVDLIWPGFILLIMSMAILLLIIHIRVTRPLKELKLQVENHLQATDESRDYGGAETNEINFLRKAVDQMIEQNKEQ
ncbi:MAG: hypothetical protein OEZ36_09905 [Spirochaetota bacterium]|nr:hypothetical protein [Spirochaetota bacterium]